MEYEVFSAWLDETLAQELPEDIVAFNFNLYEDDDNTWSVELVGTGSFDPVSEDWAGDEVFTNRETPLCWTSEKSWEDILEDVISQIRTYLSQGQYRDILRSTIALGVGFVDGDIVLL